MTEKSLVNYKTGEIIPREELCVTLSDTLALGDILQQSGMFPGVQNKAQAVAKILLGRELGLGPVYSLLKIHLIAMPNRPATLQVSAELVAGLINRSQHYRYQIAEHTNTECVINFLKDGELAYTSRFTIEDARLAGLVKPESNWTKWPRAMLWARAITQGQKIVCPELTAGADVLEDAGYDISPNGEKSKAGEPPPSAWMRFWGEARKMGYIDDGEVHKVLGVDSLKDWLNQGKTLDDALKALPNKTAEKDITELWKAEAKPVDSSPPKSAIPLTPPAANPPTFGVGISTILLPEDDAQSRLTSGVLSQPKGGTTASPAAKGDAMPEVKNWGELAGAMANLGVIATSVCQRGGFKRWQDFTDTYGLEGGFKKAWEIALSLKAEKEKAAKATKAPAQATSKLTVETVE